MICSIPPACFHCQLSVRDCDEDEDLDAVVRSLEYDAPIIPPPQPPMLELTPTHAADEDMELDDIVRDIVT